MTDLKPCPLCGSPAHTKEWDSAGSTGITVYCLWCEIEVRKANLEEAAAKWNSLPRNDSKEAGFPQSEEEDQSVTIFKQEGQRRKWGFWYTLGV